MTRPQHVPCVILHLIQVLDHVHQAEIPVDHVQLHPRALQSFLQLEYRHCRIITIFLTIIIHNHPPALLFETRQIQWLIPQIKTAPVVPQHQHVLFRRQTFHRLPDKTGKMVRVIQPEIRIVHPLVGHALFLHRVPDRPLHPLVLLLVGRKLHESRELHLRRVAARSHLIQIIPEGVIQISPTTTVKYHRVIRLRLDHRFRLVLVVTTTTSQQH